ncbi:MAG: sporulation protein [Vibrio sp.]
MSLLKKTLSNLGIGEAKVDAEITDHVLCPGQSKTMTVHLYGGNSSQRIESVKVNLQCCYWSDVFLSPMPGEERDSTVPRRDQRWYSLWQWEQISSFRLGGGQRQDLSVDITVPWNTPVTIDESKLWLESTIIDERGKETIEYQSLTVRPDPLMDRIFSHLESQGFRLRQVRCEACEGLSFPFGQTFEWVPIDGPFHGYLKELTLFICHEHDAVQLWFDVDRRQRGELTLFGSAVAQGDYLRHVELHAGLSPAEVTERLTEGLAHCESAIVDS